MKNSETSVSIVNSIAIDSLKKIKLKLNSINNDISTLIKECRSELEKAENKFSQWRYAPSDKHKGLVEDISNQLNVLEKQLEDSQSLATSKLEHTDLVEETTNAGEEQSSELVTDVEATSQPVNDNFDASQLNSMLKKFDEQLENLARLKPKADVVADLETARNDLLTTNNLSAFQTKCQRLLECALNLEPKQSTWTKGLYALLNIVTGIGTLGMLPLYSYKTTGSVMFFPVPKNETELAVNELKQEIKNLSSTVV